MKTTSTTDALVVERVAKATFGARLLRRRQGQEVRERIRAPLTASASILRLDFDEVEIVTPSFADECLGRLLLEIGKQDFRRRIQLRSSEETVRRLVNHVLATRSSELLAARAG